MPSLVIPVADESRNLTLPLALQSAQTHLQAVTPVLIGSSFLDYVIKDEAPTGRVIPFIQQVPNDPIGNVTKMMMLALEDPAVTDPFIWSNDDIYFRSALEFQELYWASATAQGKLHDQPTRGRYGMMSHRTLELLKAQRLPAWNYARHVPLIVHKEKMREALALGPGSPRSLYNNLILEEPWAVREDVKLFARDAEVSLDQLGPIFSTGNQFPIELIRKYLQLD